jgi:hypothetical protein
METTLSNEDVTRRINRSVAIRLALCFFVFFAGLTHGHFKTSDEWIVYEATASLWDTGRPSVHSRPFAHRGADGRVYSQYMLGQSLLAMPFFLIGRVAGNTLPTSWRTVLAGPIMLTHSTQATRGRSLAGGRPEITAVTLFAPVVIALLISICFLQQRQLGVSMKNAVLVSVLIGTTSYVAMHAVYFLRHGTTTALFMGALLAFQRHRVCGSAWSLFAGALMASLIPLIRLPDAILALPLVFFVAWMLFERFRREGMAAIRRATPALAVPLLLAVGFYVASNQVRWGTWFESPILAYSAAFDFPLLKGLRGFLLSPGVSVFLYSPLLLLLPWSGFALARRDRAFFALCLGTSLWLLLFYSKWDYWPGLPTAPGPRYLFAVAPLLLISLGPWLDDARGRVPWRALSGLAVVGAIVQAGLLLAEWRAVLAVLGVADEPAPWNWVFVPEKSPILGAYQVVSKGDLNTLIWRIGQGWPGFEPHPGLAIALTILWLIVLAASIGGLVRSMRRGMNG